MSAAPIGAVFDIRHSVTSQMATLADVQPVPFGACLACFAAVRMEAVKEQPRCHLAPEEEASRGVEDKAASGLIAWFIAPRPQGVDLSSRTMSWR